MRSDERLNELALFAGAGGGILGGMLSGFRTVCAVEKEPYCREVLLRRQPTLTGALEKLPTLTAGQARQGWNTTRYRENNPTLGKMAGGPLNPEWCEWFMGFPVGWTGLKPLETPRFREWLRKHGRD